MTGVIWPNLDLVAFYCYARVAQSVERWPEESSVGGSIPSLGTMTFVPDTGFDLEKLKLFELWLHKPKLLLRCEHVCSAWRTYKGQLYIKQCHRSGSCKMHGYFLCVQHTRMSRGLTKTALRYQTFSYYVGLVKQGAFHV